jgi:hypothetical protein
MEIEAPFDMPQWIHDFLKLVSVDVQDKWDSMSPVDERIKPQLHERSVRVKFHFPVEEMEFAALFTDDRCFSYSRKGICFQWRADNISSEYVEDENSRRRVLVGVVNAVVVGEFAAASRATFTMTNRSPAPR